MSFEGITSNSVPSLFFVDADNTMLWKDEREYEAKGMERQEERRRKEEDLHLAARQNVVAEASGQVRSNSPSDIRSCPQ